MYKFFAYALFSFPIVVISALAINSDFFFKSILFPSLGMSVVLYGGFIVFVIAKNFLTVRENNFVTRISTKITQLLKLPSLKVGILFNSIAFIWTLTLTVVALFISLFLLVKVISGAFGPQLRGMVSWVSESSKRESEMLRNIKDLSTQVNHLVWVRKTDLANQFFDKNQTEYNFNTGDYSYSLIYHEYNEVSYTDNNDPKYYYSIRICRHTADSLENCVFGDDTQLSESLLNLSQNEVIQVFSGKSYDIGDENVSLHKIIVTTNKRSVEYLVSTNFSTNQLRSYSNLINLLKNYSLTYNSQAIDNETLSFRYSYHNGDIFIKSGVIILRFENKSINVISDRADFE